MICKNYVFVGSDCIQQATDSKSWIHCWTQKEEYQASRRILQKWYLINWKEMEMTDWTPPPPKKNNKIKPKPSPFPLPPPQLMNCLTIFELFKWLVYFVSFFSSSQKAQRHPENRSVLILGAGYVSLPVVEYLAKSKNTEVTVGK